MHTLICGSIAYDSIMVFPGRLKAHSLPEQLHTLKVAFLVPELRREFGSCTVNIAYNLRLLGGAPLIMATVGDDHQPYTYRLDQLGLSRKHVRHAPGTFTAQAFITTDLDDNQITAFHPGAMNHAHLNHVGDAKKVSLGIIAPDGRYGMVQHAREFHAENIPFIFDPGQGLPMFTGPELLEFIQLANYVTVNDYEAQLLMDRTGCTLYKLAELVKALIVTLGSQGSRIYADDKCIEIPTVKAGTVLDPTGCGDAYRAGLLYGITHDWKWEKTGRLASLMGAIKIASRGPQNHKLARSEIAQRYYQVFGDEL